MIFHLAAVVSGQAEADFDLGMRINLDASRALLETCRAVGHMPRVVFTSSVAVYGGDLPDIVLDGTALNPQSSYGTQKPLPSCCWPTTRGAALSTAACCACPRSACARAGPMRPPRRLPAASSASPSTARRPTARGCHHAPVAAVPAPRRRGPGRRLRTRCQRRRRPPPHQPAWRVRQRRRHGARAARSGWRRSGQPRELAARRQGRAHRRQLARPLGYHARRPAGPARRRGLCGHRARLHRR